MGRVRRRCDGFVNVDDLTKYAIRNLSNFAGIALEPGRVLVMFMLGCRDKRRAEFFSINEGRIIGLRAIAGHSGRTIIRRFTSAKLVDDDLVPYLHHGTSRKQREISQ